MLANDAAPPGFFKTRLYYQLLGEEVPGNRLLILGGLGEASRFRLDLNTPSTGNLLLGGDG